MRADGSADGVLTTGLYVPGDRPERFTKAVATGADLVILDLEDAVAPAAKAAARAAVTAWLRETGAGTGAGLCPVLQVRVNGGDEGDLAALAEVAAGPDARAFEVRLPKAETLDQLDRVATTIPGVPVTVLIESSLGLERSAELAAHPAVTRVALGESDLASELGTRSPAVLQYARIRLLVAARSAGLPAPMLSAYPAIADLDGLRSDTQAGRELGWWGRTAIHPSQLPVIAEAFAPRPEEIGWARDVLAAVEAGGVATLPNGEMVDAAMLPRARAIIDRAGGSHRAG
ncbi:HpcH/HpaI aldolase/citrate lyase family protein [Herbiconiux sp. YIM B11900]|uniref:HpcH/HpaI aldolase/citrate lyase family protein n=1 Tax=Herbiconiux sp. YIM B11900 TaxID=3404131 RepID=UPI003F85F919